MNKMKLKKCQKCKTYTMQETCKRCDSKTQDAHYKFLKLRGEKNSAQNNFL